MVQINTTHKTDKNITHTVNEGYVVYPLSLCMSTMMQCLHMPDSGTITHSDFICGVQERHQEYLYGVEDGAVDKNVIGLLA
jgi:hypothetical protein